MLIDPSNNASTFSSERTVAIIGAGRQTMRKALPALLEDCVSICAVVDPRDDLQLPTSIANVRRFADVAEMLKEFTPEAAYVSVPHDVHYQTVCALLEAGVHVVKEKPFALNVAEAQDMINLAEESGARLMVATQRDLSLKYHAVHDLLPKIGTVRSVQVIETIPEPKLYDGWRANQHSSGGGVVIDLGYHMLHQLVKLFGGKTTYINGTLIKTRMIENYDVEDTAHILIGFASGVEANIILSRADNQRIEQMKVIGDSGVIFLDDDKVSFTGTGGNVVEDFLIETTETSKEMLSKCFRRFFTANDGLRGDLNIHLQVMALIDKVYLQFGGPRSCRNPQHSNWVWPRVTPDLVRDVVHQTHTTLSIYDNSGVIGEFEAKFKAYHSVPGWYSLLHNSGTNALLSLYYSAGITKGDEVIVPVYTFHATVTPLMQLGAVPVFADACPESGNIDPLAIKALINTNTKAIVVTHMWGIPCEMNKLVEICKENKILLLEDCSHAHGALLNNKPVGTFGDGAAWSLQGEKVLTGGEGGITMTPHHDMHIKMLLHGHFNKRCKVEIPKDHPLHEFALTGIGMKNRSHPLAVAIALNQLKMLPRFLEVKSAHAQYMIEKLRPVPFLIPPQVSAPSDRIQPSWYAFMIIFDEAKAPSGLTRDRFVAALHAKGLKDVDIPGSTKPLNHEPLYRHPWKVLDHLYSPDYPAERTRIEYNFKGAYRFFESTFKLPVWAFAEDRSIVEHYMNVILEVAEMATQVGVDEL